MTTFILFFILVTKFDRRINVVSDGELVQEKIPYHVVVDTLPSRDIRNGKITLLPAYEHL